MDAFHNGVFLTCVKLEDVTCVRKEVVEVSERPHRIVPVSYTHLDVYKRQGIKMERGCTI